jgi:hypothetical protein
MELKSLESQLLAEHHHDLQAAETVSKAIAEIRRGLELLSRLGHIYHLQPGVPYPLPDWPKILFHVTSAPNGRVVRSVFEAIELGYGWYPTLQEAMHKEGVKAQFRGRGGVGDRALPMLTDGGPAAPRPEGPPEPNDNRRIIDEWKKRVNGGSEAAEAANGEAARSTETDAPNTRAGGSGASGLHRGNGSDGAAPASGAP